MKEMSKKIGRDSQKKNEHFSFGFSGIIISQISVTIREFF